MHGIKFQRCQRYNNVIWGHEVGTRINIKTP